MPGPSDTGALVGVGVGRGGGGVAWGGVAWGGAGVARGGVARGRAGVARGEAGLAASWTTAIGARVGAAVARVTTGTDGMGDGCAEATGDGAMDGPGVCPSPGSSDGRGPTGVGFTAGPVATGVALAAAGAVGTAVAKAVPDVGMAPMSGVGVGADSPYPNATVARTRLTTPRASTSRRRCVPLTWILGSPNVTGGQQPAAPRRRW